MTEKQIETQILTWLNYQKDFFCFKINTVGIFDPVRKVFRKNQNRFVINGTSDILGLYKGRFIAIEVKTPQTYKQFMTYIIGDKPISPSNNKVATRALQQQDFIDKINDHGGSGIVVHSLDQVIDWFKKL